MSHSVQRAQVVTTGHGPLPADAAWLAPSTAASQVDWKFDTGITATGTTKIAYEIVPKDATVVPDTLLPLGHENNIVFSGLPASNSAFGNHTITMTVKTTANGTTTTNDSEIAHLQTFFWGSKRNHYGADKLTTDEEPNWYHYYETEYQVTGTDGGRQRYVNSDQRSRITLWPPFEIKVQNDGYFGGNFFNAFVFDTDPALPHHLRLVGTLKIKGIYMYAFVCAHELTHHNLSLRTDAQRVYNWKHYDANNNPIPGTGTSDGDNVVDDWEDRWQINGFPVLDSTKIETDTANAYLNANAGEPGDDEAIADIGALGLLLQQNLWSKDWAAEPNVPYNGGIQYGPLYWHSNPIANPPVFYLEFQPQSGIPVEGQPATGAARLANGNYPIRNLADLQALHPRVLTSIPDSVL